MIEDIKYLIVACSIFLCGALVGRVTSDIPKHEESITIPVKLESKDEKIAKIDIAIAELKGKVKAYEHLVYVPSSSLNTYIQCTSDLSKLEEIRKQEDKK